ncbi:MAG: TonB-dependent receptor [Campylobacterota bacterium]|nr:TonB-dependent receptor [Campylobacterota bacterium]
MIYLNIKKIIFSSIFLISSLSANENLFDEDIEDILSMKSELKADIGSRDGARDYLTSNTPVDMITAQQIEDSGLTSLTDVLRYFVAGVNAPETSIADGSDHTKAFTLRGMNPDQILVLINGKRLHTSALLHVNGTIGRGSSHVDLNTIPLASIEKVEILRDGAAAQYGSDAIAGVINIILKGFAHSNSFNVHAGARKVGDGEQLQTNLFISTPLQYDGFINFTLDFKEQKQTQRAGIDNRLDTPKITTDVGVPDSKDYKALLYTEIPQENNINIYSRFSLNYRDSEAGTFFRPYSIDSQAIYSDGFLPKLKARVLDYFGIIGIKGELKDSITWDLSNSYGSNNFHYLLENSMNYSLGADSPTSFDNGNLNFSQNTTTLDFRKSDDRFKVAGGLEFRYEKYKIEAGDEESYAGTASEGFAGYHPDNKVNEDRYNYAVYVDSIYDFSKNFMFEVALRYEEYSDFGESTNGKIALSYKITPKLMFRTSGSTGFRAPSLAQSFYSQTSSFVNSMGVLTTQGTFRNQHEISKSLGAKELVSERSKHFTIGTVFKANKNSSLTIDYFYIDVNDKIILTPELSAQTQEQKDMFNKYNVSAARFFHNGARMSTQGVDIKLDYLYLLSKSSNLDFRVWYNYNKNSVKKENDISMGSSNKATTIMYESGQPRDSIKILTQYEYQKLKTTLNISRYGSYSQMMNNQLYKFNSAWTTDLNIAYNFTREFQVAMGGINIFDTMPNRWGGLSGDLYGTDGIKQYSRYSPFGYSGAYYYLKASMKF